MIEGFLACLAIASTSFTMSATAVSSPNEAPRVCVARAVDGARSKALELAPREMSNLFLDIQAAHNQRETQFVHSYSSTLQRALLIVDKVQEQPLQMDKDGITRCTVSVTGHFIETGTADPSFQIRNLALNQPSYFSEQSAEITFELTSDAYVYVLAVDEAQEVTLVFPNAHTPSGSNFLRAGEKWVFPSASDRGRGVALRAVLPNGKHESVELLQVIAVKDTPGLFSGRKTKRVGAYELISLDDMSAVVSKLGQIDRKKWATATAPYTIRTR